MYNGFDIKVNIGDIIVVVFDGKVCIVKYECRGYGKYVVICYDNGLEIVYGYLFKQLVEENQLVKVGELIVLGGNIGCLIGFYFYFEICFLGIVINLVLMFDFLKQDIVVDIYMFRKIRGYECNRVGFYDINIVLDGEIRYYKVKKGDSLF